MEFCKHSICKKYLHLKFNKTYEYNLYIKKRNCIKCVNIQKKQSISLSKIQEHFMS